MGALANGASAQTGLKEATMLDVKVDHNGRKYACVSNAKNVVLETYFTSSYAMVDVQHLSDFTDEFSCVAYGFCDNFSDARDNMRGAIQAALPCLVGHTELDEWDLKDIMGVFAEFIADVNA